MNLANNKTSRGDVIFLAAGEILIGALTVLGFYLAGAYHWRVLTGAALGALVTVLNYCMLSFSVNRAVSRVMAERGQQEMSEEEAAVFAAAHTAEVQKSVKSSYMIRQVLLLLLLVVPLLLKVVNVLAIAIPLLLFRPVLMVRELIMKKTKKGA